MGSKFSYKSKNTVFVLFLSVSLISVMVIGNLNVFTPKYPLPETNNLEPEVVVEEEPDIPSVGFQEKTKIYVHIDGEVNKPGVVELLSGSRLHDAVELAGGLTDKANTKGVNLAQRIEDGLQYIIPDGENNLEILGGNLSQSNGAQETFDQKYDEEGRLNINTATKQELSSLPGIGEVLSQRILDLREEKGGFKLIEDVKSVTGIGDKKYEDIKDKIYIK